MPEKNPELWASIWAALPEPVRAAFLAACVDVNGAPASEEHLMATLNGQTNQAFWQGLALQPIAAVNLKFRFKFEADPQP